MHMYASSQHLVLSDKCLRDPLGERCYSNAGGAGVGNASLMTARGRRGDVDSLPRSVAEVLEQDD